MVLVMEHTLEPELMVEHTLESELAEAHTLELVGVLRLELMVAVVGLVVLLGLALLAVVAVHQLTVQEQYLN
jgi:hypothetical protein